MSCQWTMGWKECQYEMCQNHREHLTANWTQRVEGNDRAKDRDDGGGVGVGFQCTDRVSSGVDEGTPKNEVLGVA